MKARILLIEDHTDLREATGELLGLYDYDVLLASNGLEGLAAALSRPPGLILSDLRMPGMDGYELVRRLQADQRTRMIPVILTSANFDRSTLYPDLAGVSSYLAKPFDEETLLSYITQALQNRA